MSEGKSLEGLIEELSDHPAYVEKWRGNGVRLRQEIGEIHPKRLRIQLLKETIDILEIESPIIPFDEERNGKEKFNDEELRLILQALREGYK